MTIKNLKDLYIVLLQDIYNGEQQLTKALPKMAEAAASNELAQAFTSHLEETKGQIVRLDQVFAELNVDARGETCEAMKGLIEEAKEFIEIDVDAHVRDAGLIAYAQKVEHYEIASYGALCAFATQLGFTEQAKLLEETLNQEKGADNKLNQFALRTANPEAKAAA